MVESKDSMARRGLKSPDRADAVMAAIAIKPFVLNSKLDDLGWIETLEEEFESSILERNNIMGADAGI